MRALYRQKSQACAWGKKKGTRWLPMLGNNLAARQELVERLPFASCIHKVYYFTSLE